MPIHIYVVLTHNNQNLHLFVKNKSSYTTFIRNNGQWLGANQGVGQTIKHWKAHKSQGIIDLLFAKMNNMSMSIVWLHCNLPYVPS